MSKPPNAAENLSKSATPKESAPVKPVNGSSPVEKKVCVSAKVQALAAGLRLGFTSFAVAHVRLHWAL